jgi:hypothetical protein
MRAMSRRTMVPHHGFIRVGRPRRAHARARTSRHAGTHTHTNVVGRVCSANPVSLLCSYRTNTWLGTITLPVAPATSRWPRPPRVLRCTKYGAKGVEAGTEPSVVLHAAPRQVYSTSRQATLAHTHSHTHTRNTPHPFTLARLRGATTSLPSNPTPIQSAVRHGELLVASKHAAPVRLTVNHQASPDCVRVSVGPSRCRGGIKQPKNRNSMLWIALRARKSLQVCVFARLQVPPARYTGEQIPHDGKPRSVCGQMHGC